MTSKIEPFEKVDFTFKLINHQPIDVTILIPKILQSKPSNEYPVLVNWHGGGFIIGHRMYEGWLPPWLLDLCITTPCILIAPDYRLLPEANASEVLSDVEDFWKWLHNSLPSVISPWHARPDLARIACAGSSAGAYLAVQSALLFPELSQIKLIISIAGSLYTDIPHYRVPGPKVILGKRPPPPREAEMILRKYLRNIKPGTIRTSGDPIEMWDFLACVLQQAYLPRWLGMKRNEKLDVMKMLEKAKGMPPIWVVHGEQDSVVPPICSTSFVDRLRTILPDVPVLLTLQPGDHGFEVMHTVEDTWVQEGFEFVKKCWH